MKVRVYSLKPYWDIEGHFIDIENQPTFDPKHPSIYPGNEVRLVETLPAQEAIVKYGKNALCFGDILYTDVYTSGKDKGQIAIFELTGKTSADIIRELR